MKLCQACAELHPPEMIKRFYIYPVQWYHSSGPWKYLCHDCIAKAVSAYPSYVISQKECEERFKAVLEAIRRREP